MRLLLLLLLLLKAGVGTSGRWRRRIAGRLRADRRGYGSSTVTWRLRGINLQRRFVFEHEGRRSGHSVGAVTSTCSIANRCSHRIVVRSMMSVNATVVMSSTDDAVTYDAMMAATGTAVMILLTACGTSGRLSRPLVATVGIVKQRVLMRLRIRVKVVVDLGLQLLGDGRRGCCCCRRGSRRRCWYSAANGTRTTAGHRRCGGSGRSRRRLE